MKRVTVTGAKVNRPRPNPWDKIREGNCRSDLLEKNRDEDGLTIPQRAFVENYLVSGSVTDAYRQAAFDGHFKIRDEDYKYGVAGYSMIRTPHVDAAIKKRQKHFQDKMEISQERVLREYACIAFSKLTDFYTVTDNDVIIRRPDELSPEQQAAIMDISIFENVVTGTRRVAKVKLHDKNDALKSLSKYLGLFDKDNKQRSTVNIQIDDILTGLPKEVSDAVRLQLSNDVKPKDDVLLMNNDSRTIN